MQGTIILTGFMGTGKTTVGQLVAQQLNRDFVDLDQRIEEAAGQSIPDLFTMGEEVFRKWERQVLEALNLEEPLVVATGGGTLVGAWNQQRVANVPTIVLDARLETVQARVGEDAGRPLASRLPDLYQRRNKAYARLPFHVPTDHRPPEEIADEVIALAGQAPPAKPRASKTETLEVQVPSGKGYAIHVGRGVAATIGQYLRHFEPGMIAIVTDSRVGPLWGETVRHDLLAAGLATTVIELPAGEEHKTLETVSWLYDRLLEGGVDRSGAVVALGGGVVGDTAGFAAATWMRGVRTFVQVPTTLLSMVDASVGGKTGVDHPRGKNLIGAFRHPDLVLVDPVFLGSLPLRDLRGGLAEVVKHGVIADPVLFYKMQHLDLAVPESIVWEPLLARAIRVKVDIVERDPLERGERAKLNLGHTFAHAYELLSAYQLPHGEAVGIGLVSAARLSEDTRVAEAGLAATIAGTLARLGLPTVCSSPPDGETLWEAMQSDKKRGAGGLRFILPRSIGDVVVTPPGSVTRDQVIQAVTAQHEQRGKS